MQLPPSGVTLTHLTIFNQARTNIHAISYPNKITRITNHSIAICIFLDHSSECITDLNIKCRSNTSVQSCNIADFSGRLQAN